MKFLFYQFYFLYNIIIYNIIKKFIKETLRTNNVYTFYIYIYIYTIIISTFTYISYI